MNSPTRAEAPSREGGAVALGPDMARAAGTAESPIVASAKPLSFDSEVVNASSAAVAEDDSAMTAPSESPIGTKPAARNDPSASPAPVDDSLASVAATDDAATGVARMSTPFSTVAFQPCSSDANGPSTAAVNVSSTAIAADVISPTTGTKVNNKAMIVDASSTAGVNATSVSKA